MIFKNVQNNVGLLQKECVFFQEKGVMANYCYENWHIYDCK